MRIIRYESPIGAQTGIVTADNEVVKAIGNIAEGFTPGEVIAPLADVDILAPLEPGKIVAIGRNYLEHVKELDKTATVPEFPVMFMKPPSAVIGPGAPIRLANPENETHYEAELCVVIGKTATDVEEASALDYVFGYTCGNDVSDRKVQFASGQWIQGKGYDSYCPLGPWIETELDPGDVLVQSRLSGEARQSEPTSSLIFSVPFLISYISKVMTLYPGDVIMTGTPHGVGPMKAGDTIEIEIAGIGVLSNPVVNR
ncbi:MAG: fumarylacetoacetate hydrolase family protein [Thermomicrobiales bacterium]|nr:fumarylacetoacetate hydrolase family protein [Thermomicrobiales bacterium]MCO5227058.1 fumarylacetoacetate hydrolase family protein [Thermomicrobiales bacterium]